MVDAFKSFLLAGEAKSEFYSEIHYLL